MGIGVTHEADMLLVRYDPIPTRGSPKYTRRDQRIVLYGKLVRHVRLRRLFQDRIHGRPIRAILIWAKRDEVALQTAFHRETFRGGKIGTSLAGDLQLDHFTRELVQATARSCSIQHDCMMPVDDKDIRCSGMR